jgi:hypothetical protein
MAQPPSAAKYVLAAAIGVIVAAGIGAAAIVYARSRADETPVQAMPQRAPVVALPSVHTVATTPSFVELHGLPADAVLHVGGVALAPDVRLVARPPHGSTTEVLITAPGFTNETLKVDDGSPASVEVAMTLQSPPEETAKPPTAPTTGAVTGAVNAPPTTPRIALPANPY